MAKLKDNPTEPSFEPPKSQKLLLLRLFFPSKKKAIAIMAIASLGGIAYLGLDFWVKRNLPSIIESQGSKLLNRPVEVGKIESFSLTGITIDSASVPATTTEKDNVTINAVRVGFNLLPVIFRRSLPVSITLIQPKVYLEQKADGSWLNLDLPQQQGGESLISLDIIAQLEQANITVVPYEKSLLNIQLDGEGRYNQEQQGQLQYDLEAKIAQAKATIQGETLLETGTTVAKLLIKDLALTDAISVIPNVPVNLTQGVVNGDLDVNIPSGSELTSANVEGTLRVGEVRGDVASREIEGKSWLRFGGSKVEVTETQARIETIEAKVAGAVDLQQGYDLDVTILPFDLATLPKTLATELPVPATGEIKGDIQLRGDIKQPRLTGKIINTKPLTVDKESLKTLSANFSADLDKFTLQDLRIIPAVGGIVRVKGEIATNIQRSLANNQAIDVTRMPLDFIFQADLSPQAIASPYYQFPDNTSGGNFSSEGIVTGTIAELRALLKWRLEEANISGEIIQGGGQIVFANNNLRLQDTVVEVGAGKIDVEGTSNLEKKTWQTEIAGNDLSLTPFLSQLQLEAINLNHSIIVNNAQANLSGRLDNISPEKIQGLASINLDVNNNPLIINSSLNRGEINATANTETIVLDRYISRLPTPVTIQSSKVNLSAQIAPLLNWQAKPDLSSVKTNINANLLVAEGIVTTQGSLENNQWQGSIQGNSLKPSLLSPQLPENLAPVNTNIQLSGNLQPLIAQPENVSLKAEQIELTMGQQYLNATGDIILSNLLTNPDIVNVALAVDTRLDFNNLFLEEIILSNNQQSLINIPTILGQAKLTGKLQGKNLISKPTQPGNIFLSGDITLNNLAVNDTVFDPVMTGNINIDPKAQMAIALQGQQDIIAATAEPCMSSRCRLPYLPTHLNFRINGDRDNSIMATGNRQGDIFKVNVVQFPLAFLNITPAKPVGLDFSVGGIVTADVGINLFSLGTRGNITVEKPGVGYIEADKLTANFNYDLERNWAEVTTASLLLKNSEYNFNGNLDLASGEIQGKLNIPQAYIQDILTTLRWYSIADVIDLFDYAEFASAEAVKVKNIKTAGKPIDYKLQLLRTIEQQLQEIAAAQISSNLPTQLNIKGGYTGEVLIAGNMTNPEVNWNIDAQNWQWKPRKAKTTVPDRGEVKYNSQVVSLPQIQLQGDLKNQVLNLDIAKLQLEDATFSATGKLSPRQQDANFELSNLSVDTISKLVTIPVDVTGTINSTARLKGTLDQPEVKGNFIFADGTFNQQKLSDNIAGNYSYQNQKLNFNIISPESIQIAATIPYPIKPQVNDLVTANVKLTTEAFTLLGPLTKNNLTWTGGEGDLEIVATANIDPQRPQLLDNLEAQGKVILDQVQIKTANIAEILTATGKITLNNQIINVESLKAIIGNKNLSIAGKFPLLDAVNNLENPLTINIPPGKIELKELYQGGLAGNIILTGTALEPLISGEVSLENGILSIPDPREEEDPERVATTNLNRNSASSYQVLAKDFSVKLDEFRLEEQSLSLLGILQPIDLYGFKVLGELNLNGTLNNISQLRGEGTIKVIAGAIGWLASDLAIVRDWDNQILFSPQSKITNPYLDIQLRANVEDLEQIRQLEPGENEVFDDILSANRINKIDVRMNIQGKVEEILGTATQINASCDISPDNVPITRNSIYLNSKLKNIANCVKSNRSLLDGSGVTLSSTPYRSKGEIISLLGYQTLNFDQNTRNASLLDLGFSQFIYRPIERRFLLGAEDFFLNVGKNIGIDYFRVFPFVELSSQLGNSNFYIRGIYDSNIVRPESTSIDTNNNQEVYELRLEYQLKF